MRHVKKLTITLVGGVLLLLGILLIVLPGPAMLIIPLALVILSTEYPGAKDWLKRFQRMLSKGGRAMDRWVQKIRR